MQSEEYEEAYRAFKDLANSYSRFDDNDIVMVIEQAEKLYDGNYHELQTTLELMNDLDDEAIDMIVYKHPVLGKALALNGTWIYSGGWDNYNHEPLLLEAGVDRFEFENGETWQYAPAKSWNYQLYAMEVEGEMEIFVSKPTDIKNFYWKIEGFLGEGDREFVLHRYAKKDNHNWTMTYKIKQK